MKLFLKLIFIFYLIAFFLPAFASQDDSVIIEYDPGFVSVRSVEKITLKLNRKLYGSSENRTEMDRYFNNISTLIDKANGESLCGPIIVDSSSVAITISIDGKTTKFVCSYSRAGFSLPIDPSEKDKKNKQTLDQILFLTINQINVRFPQS